MLGILLEKIRNALHTNVCGYCSKETSGRDSLFCQACQIHLAFRSLEPVQPGVSPAIYAATRFNAPMKRLIYGYKFYERQSDAPLLADVLIQYWQGLPVKAWHPENVAVIPIPPHPGKESHLQPIAMRFARHFGYELASQALAWNRPTDMQHMLQGRKARFDNVAFSMTASRRAFSEQPHAIILLDDLTTTGATLLEAARALYEGDLADESRPVLALAISQVPVHED